MQAVVPEEVSDSGSVVCPLGFDVFLDALDLGLDPFEECLCFMSF